MNGFHPEQEILIEEKVGLTTIQEAVRVLTDWENGQIGIEQAVEVLAPIFVGEEKLLRSFIDLTKASDEQKRLLKHAFSTR